MKEFAIRIHIALKWLPTQTITVEKKCAFLPTLFQPHRDIARNVDSIKKANTASIASGLPNTSPTKVEYIGQLVPNWNTITIPVTTPTANIIPKSFRKNFAAFKYFIFPVLSHIASTATMYRENPIEIGGNKK